MGLLDIWNDWKKENQGTVQDDFSGMNSDMQTGNLNTAGGVENPLYNRKESPLIKNPIFPTDSTKGFGKVLAVPPGQGQITIGGKTFNAPKSILTKDAQANQAKAIAAAQNNTATSASKTLTDPITQGGSGVKQAEDMGFMQKLSNMAGVDFDKAAANWKDKGGFEGLMANPAFSLGLALMQSSANGKTINQGILDNFVKSAKISTEFKDRIEARKQEPIQATAADMAETTDLLKQIGIEEGNWFENFGSKVKSIFTGKGGNPGLEWQTAVEEISLQYQIAVRDAQEKLKQAGKSQVLRKSDKIKIMNDLVKSGKIQKNSAWFGGLFTSDTLKNALPGERAQGGPVEAGKPYVVGEKGPEIIIPTSDGNVLSNDDSQIFNMLLASNPQLQKVSRQRAEKVLRSRFPEYFEG
ncbi:tape measure protein [uncultured Mediterranean phage uvMED]|nr:tape measure protein [uncultured Mediterranean phage uvMED]BAR37955.1 phage tail tape measure protein [uncultured Mediterranean phage uvMED]